MTSVVNETSFITEGSVVNITSFVMVSVLSRQLL